MVGKEEAKNVFEIWFLRFLRLLNIDSTNVEKYDDILTIAANYCGCMCGWKPPWEEFCHISSRIFDKIVLLNYTPIATTMTKKQ